MDQFLKNHYIRIYRKNDFRGKNMFHTKSALRFELLTVKKVLCKKKEIPVMALFLIFFESAHAIFFHQSLLKKTHTFLNSIW